MLWERLNIHARQQPGQLALRDPQGTLSYAELDQQVRTLSQSLPERKTADPAEPGERIALLCSPGQDWCRAFMAVLASGHVAVPLALMHPPAEWRYVLQDAGCSRIWASPEWAERIRSTAEGEAAASSDAPSGKAIEGLGIPVEVLPDLSDPMPVHVPRAFRPKPETPAFIIYTSGSTGKPKGVLHTHGSLAAQVQSLTEAWAWSSSDRILNVLPLHHIHGMVNIYASALWNGAAIREMQGFDAQRLWAAFGEPVHPTGSLDNLDGLGPDSADPPTLFMAVPTVYQKLLQYAAGLSLEAQQRLRQACAGFRLMVSGSAALPVPLLQAWEAQTGQRLLERYGMSEIGMGLSQLLEGPRHPGTVGKPLPGVQCRIRPVRDEAQAQEEEAVSTPSASGSLSERELEDAVTGELLVRGPGLFARYWERPQATAEAFWPAAPEALETAPEWDAAEGPAAGEDAQHEAYSGGAAAPGWFCTGDVVACYTHGPKAGHYRILGRSSVDILKSGGYKISALEIEAALLAHPSIREAAVVGLEDPEWGQRIAALLVLEAKALERGNVPAADADKDEDLDDNREDAAARIRAWRAFLEPRLAPYKIPREWRYAEALPRNALGKVVKPNVLSRWSEWSL
jgi:malonyl-CoA/methylmalonyl-CoA synthetase